jgi:cell division GTPase FtsZ
MMSYQQQLLEQDTQSSIKRLVAVNSLNFLLFIVNCAVQALKANPCDNKLQIGRDLTRGLGTGGKVSSSRT